MSSTDESIRYVGENLGDDSSEDTSKRSGSYHPLTSAAEGGAFARRLVACWMSHWRRGDEEEENSSPGKIDPVHREERVLPETRGSRPSGST
ncbi:UNVERIFIED_CONTAM: hypothetical protein Slati_0763700 [Sesamum latifolium]|uniref:Uncharacterized protein n=1 Tax=Sesamum latifolium TaxID=2727402 RepID=A0AAW2XR20_9LAMI